MPWSGTGATTSPHGMPMPGSSHACRRPGWRCAAFRVISFTSRGPSPPVRVEPSGCIRRSHAPDLATANIRSEFDAFPWEDDSQELRAWEQGRTGIPLVDAGMRELWATGYMHNRVRMVVASFLTKNLRQHWTAGEQWFWDTLCDADEASNAFNWQWVAGTGDDAAPYFRVFNPERQAARFDPDGTYVRRWVPEAFQPGSDYPEPIVDLKASRQDALDAYARLRT